jgi:hypothetical protein
VSVELTDIASVRQFMQKAVADKLQDADLEALIRQASAAVQRHCNRQFVREDHATHSFEFLPVGGGWELVDLKPYEFRTIKAVKLDPDLTPTTLTAAQYRPGPYPPIDGTFFLLRLAELPDPPALAGLQSAATLPYQTRRIDVEADWGLLEVPSEVEHLTNVVVEAWCHLRREGVPGSTLDFGEAGQPPKPEDFPAAARWGLKRWVRPTAEV